MTTVSRAKQRFHALVAALVVTALASLLVHATHLATEPMAASERTDEAVPAASSWSHHDAPLNHCSAPAWWLERAPTLSTAGSSAADAFAAHAPTLATASADACGVPILPVARGPDRQAILQRFTL